MPLFELGIIKSLISLVDTRRGLIERDSLASKILVVGFFLTAIIGAFMHGGRAFAIHPSSMGVWDYFIFIFVQMWSFWIIQKHVNGIIGFIVATLSSLLVGYLSLVLFHGFLTAVWGLIRSLLF